MELYVSNILDSYKDTIIGHFGNISTADFSVYIVKSWRACTVDEENFSLPMVL